MSVAEDRRRIATRLNVLQWGAVVIFAALAMSFWFLQVVQHDKYDEMNKYYGEFFPKNPPAPPTQQTAPHVQNASSRPSG